MSAYVTVDELEGLGINKKAIDSFSDAEKQTAIEAASSEADVYIARRVNVPLVTVPLAVKSHIARMAVFSLLSSRGMSPEKDKLVVDNYDRAIRFFNAVGAGNVTLPGMEAPADDPADDWQQPEVFSDEPRGL
jgi:phage gp36-like protein